MARTFLSHGVSLGPISSSTSSDGMMRFSSAPFVGDYYIHLGVYVFFYWIQVLGRGRMSINVTERVKRCETKTLELDSSIPLLGRVGNMRPDLIIPGSKSRRQAWLCQTTWKSLHCYSLTLILLTIPLYWETWMPMFGNTVVTHPQLYVILRGSLNKWSFLLPAYWRGQNPEQRTAQQINDYSDSNDDNKYTFSC